MRMSRRAVIKAHSVNWDKYLYELRPQRKLVEYTMPEWKLLSVTYAGGVIAGRTGYIFYVNDDCGWETFVLTLTGDRERVDADNPGTVYLLPGNKQNTIQKYVVNSDGSVELYEMVFDVTYTELDAEWRVMDYVSVARAKKGALPDAGRGYTYEKTDGEYTIMTDGENYYAYKLWG